MSTKAKKKSKKKERRKCISELACTVDQLVQSENLHDLAKTTGIPQTTLSEWKNVNIPVTLDRAVTFLEACGISVVLIDESEEDEEND